MNKLFVAATTLISITAFTAIAATSDFKAADKNGNGTVSYEELIVLMPSASQKQFAAADIDGSGELSKEEYTKATSSK